MRVAIPKETFEGETRVAATPETVARLVALGLSVSVEAGAGVAAHFGDTDYEAAGAEVVADTRALWQQGEVVLKVRAPGENKVLGCDEVELLRPDAIVASFLWPGQNPELVKRLAARGVSVIAMDQVPRISRAQKMDALSSLANIAGYRAVLEAAGHFGRFFTGQITAAGRLPPAKVLVIGAGVAGLQAIATARSMGAVVRAFDTRLAVRDEVKSLGGEFLELEFEESGEGQGGYAKTMSDEFIAAEMALFRQQATEVDIVITTALIPGRPAPKLWDAGMVESMKAGSVVVDLAALQGGNCELTEPGTVCVRHGVTLVGHTELTWRLPTTASQLYGSNLVHLLEDMIVEREEGGADGEETEASVAIDLEDEILRGATVVHGGVVVWPPPKREPPPKTVAPAPAAAPAEADPEPAKAQAAPPRATWGPMAWLVAAAAAGLWGWLRFGAGDMDADMAAASTFLQHLTVFVLACFIGWQVIWSVTPALHTPLMSVTNAISGIIIVGGMLHASTELTSTGTALGLAAVFFATINICGGFLVTQRMLKMFHR